LAKPSASYSALSGSAYIRGILGFKWNNENSNTYIFIEYFIKTDIFRYPRSIRIQNLELMSTVIDLQEIRGFS
jgi:hypothetical protein